ncbi:MAG: hypothetical protein HY832_02670 [Candidatus Aenigmarchaeota archaeon]|nr:hypothetical protein [Candidatus Aenigmarchaeota archaeon]
MGEEKNCCKNREKSGLLRGLLFGLVPHAGCIAFIALSVLGVATGAALFRPLLLNSSFFYGMIAFSLIVATLSAYLYLKKNGCACRARARREWKYLSVLYGTTIAVNVLLFTLIFPALANANTGMMSAARGDKLFQLEVDILCPGHAPLVTEELKRIDGIVEITYTAPNIFHVLCDSRVTREQILSLDIFRSFPATITEEKMGI